MKGGKLSGLGRAVYAIDQGRGQGGAVPRQHARGGSHLPALVSAVLFVCPHMLSPGNTISSCILVVPPITAATSEFM